jgi:DNA-binding MarR family transcriptional regulator
VSSEIPTAWVRFLRAHAEVTSRMDRHLADEHGLSLREYEVLLALNDAPGRRLRRVDLAAAIFLTQSGVTRLLEKLERDGLVAKVAGESDRRVVYAQLTAEGRRRFVAAALTHRADIAEHFTDRLTARDLAALDRALAKLPGGESDAPWRTPQRGTDEAASQATRSPGRGLA